MLSLLLDERPRETGANIGIEGNLHTEVFGG